MKQIYLSIGLSLLGMIGFSQQFAPQNSEERLKLADVLFDRMDYTDAIAEYKRLLRGDKTDNYVHLRLAESYYNIFNTVESAKWYGKAIEKNPNLEADIYYKYAQMLKASGRYKVANIAMKKFADMKPDDSRAIEFLKNPNYIPHLRAQEALFTFSDSGMNDAKHSDFAGILTENNVFYFTTSRNEENKIYKWNEEPFLDIYTAKYNLEDGKFTDIAPVSELNTKYHDGPVAITSDGQTMYFASESFRDSKYTVDAKRRLKLGAVNLFRAKFDDGKWVDVEPLPFNGEDYMTSNPSVTLDGKTLYFASDMPGTKGGMDIWKVTVNEDGTFGEPENLGDKVNTEGRESFPFISEENKLYFASDALKGFGGLDLYMIDLNNPEAEVINLGDPINTPKDDFGFSFYPSKGIGFLSTNRVGRDDIYKVFPVCTEEITVSVVDDKTGKTLVGTKVNILDHDNNIVDTKYTNEAGVVRYDADCERNFSIQLSKNDYENKTMELERTSGGSKIVEAKLRPIEVIVVNKKIELGDIFFEFNKYNITQKGAFELDKLVEIMRNNPSMKIKIESHTDSKGSDKYNLKLSELRANSTRQYIISKGISSERLVAKGYGETHPKIDCGDNCTDQQHATNRRSEFIIIEE